MNLLMVSSAVDFLSTLKTAAPAISSVSAASSPGNILATSIVPEIGRIVFTLAELCSYVDASRPLQLARIVSTACYVEDAGGVLHRFLVIELRVFGRKTIYLRIDRRMAKNVSFWSFLKASGETDANDVAQLTSQKEVAIAGGRLENVQKFADSPLMSKLRRLLGIVIEEIATYQLWPANCWYFCSVIQEFLGRTSDGWFEQGDVKHGHLALDVSSRIEDRFALVHDVPTTLTLSEWLSCIEDDQVCPPHILEKASAALALSLRWDAAQDITTPQDMELCEKLVKALAELAAGLRKSSLPDKAKSASENTISLARKLHRRYPLWHRGILASQLHLLGVPLHDSDCLNGPCASKRLVVALQLQLYEERSDLNALGLGDSLIQHGNLLHANSRYDDACIVKAEAVDIAYENYEADPSAISADLASFLDSYGASLHAADRYTDACSAKDDAVILRRKMPKSDLRKYRTDLAQSLYSFGISLYEAKRYDAACPAHEEAISLLRKLYDSDPTAYHANLARCLLSYGTSLSKVNKLDDGCAAVSEAVRLQHQMYETDPEPNCALLATYLDQYGIILHSIGRRADECNVKQQAVALSRQAYRLDPDTNRINLVKHLFSLGMSLDKVKDNQGACLAKGESITLLRELYQKDQQKHSGRLIRYLGGYSKTLIRAGRSGEACAVDREARQLRTTEPNGDEGTQPTESTQSRSEPS